MILAVIWPLVNYQFFYAPRFSYIFSPVPDGMTVPIASAASPQDYTDIKNWFSQANTDEIKDEFEGSSYLFSIPKLKIEGANVIIGAQDLTQNLSHYPGTGLPGRPGNTVILGHSVLPQFFNPKNYLTIFSTLYRLNLGDKIIVTYDGVEYYYSVEEMYEVEPTNLSPLKQRFDDSFVTLITCSPPGTYLRRLIVRARLVEQ